MTGFRFGGNSLSLPLSSHLFKESSACEPVRKNFTVGERIVVICNHQITLAHFQTERSSRQPEEFRGAIPVLTNTDENL